MSQREERSWSQKHLKAAGIVGASPVMTPPSQDGDEMGEGGEGMRGDNGGREGRIGDNGARENRMGMGSNTHYRNASTARCVDIRGPDGYTPLMLASCKSLKSNGFDDDSMISTLIAQGAAVNATTDTTGL